MKRYGNLYPTICSFENLYLASRKARLGKRGKVGCASFEMNLEDELWRLHDELVSGSYRPGPYRTFTIHERRPRFISAAPYRDRVVHHALCMVIEPIFERSFIHDSYACRIGKGTHAGVERFTKFSRRYRYVLKTDIRKYFPSIDHDLLFEQIERKIKCRDTLRLVRLIIDGSNPQGEAVSYFPGDTLLTPLERRRGIPIGNLTSQFFANVYLNCLDHFVTEELKCRAYIRYVDDIVVFGDDKQMLWRVRDDLTEYLVRLRLTLHPDKTIVQPVTVGTDHLGYRIFPDHRLLRKDTSLRFSRRIEQNRRLMKSGCITEQELNTSVQSWLGHARHADTWGLRRNLSLL